LREKKEAVAKNKWQLLKRAIITRGTRKEERGGSVAKKT